MRILFFTKSHVSAYTRKDGTFVAAHEDKRRAADKKTSNDSKRSGGLSPDVIKKLSGTKVVDAHGKPMKVFHGGERVITDFSSAAKRGGELGVAFFTDSLDVAESYAKHGVPPDAAADESQEKLHRDGAVTHAYLAIKKPVPADPEEFFGGDMQEALDFIERTADWHDMLELKDYIENEDSEGFWEYYFDAIPAPRDMSAANSSLEDYPFLQYLDGVMTESAHFRDYIRKHYDGFIFDDAESGGTTYVVFSPDQIFVTNSDGPGSQMAKSIPILFFKA